MLDLKMSFAWDIGEHVPFEVSKMCTGEGPPSLKIHRLSTGRTERHFTRQLLLLQGPSPVLVRFLIELQQPQPPAPAAAAAAASPQWRWPSCGAAAPPPPNSVSMLSTRPRTNEVCQYGVLATFGVSTGKLPQQVLFASHLHQPTWGFFDDQSTPSKHSKPVEPLSSWKTI